MKRMDITRRKVDRKKVQRKPLPKNDTPEGKVIKLQVDYRTIIIVRSKKALQMWMERYPNAKIVA